MELSDSGKDLIITVADSKEGTILLSPEPMTSMIVSEGEELIPMETRQETTSWMTAVGYLKETGYVKSSNTGPAIGFTFSRLDAPGTAKAVDPTTAVSFRCSAWKCDRPVFGGFQAITHEIGGDVQGKRTLWCCDHEEELNDFLGNGRYVTRRELGLPSLTMQK